MPDTIHGSVNGNGQKPSVTLDNLVLMVDDLAIMVKEGFDDVHKRMATKEDLKELRSEIKGEMSKMATKEDIAAIRKEMATKEDVGKLRSDMIDYIAKQNLELKTDLVIITKGGDKKLFTLIELMVERKLITKDDANRVTRLEPFPQTV